MKFLVVLCLLAVAAADDDKNQEKKTQLLDSSPSQGLTTSAGSLLSNPVFPGSGFPGSISNFGYTGFNTPIQTVNPDFFNAGSATHGGIAAFPVTRTVFSGTPGVVSGIQSFPVQGGGFPVQGGAFPLQGGAYQGGVFPGVVQGLASQFPAAGANFLSGVQGVTNGGLDANTAAANGALSAAQGAYRFLTQDALSGIGAQGLQSSGIPAFTGGILSTLGNGLLQGQTIPTGVLKNPTTGTNSGISNIPGLTTGNISGGPLTNVFRSA